MAVDNLACALGVHSYDWQTKGKTRKCCCVRCGVLHPERPVLKTRTYKKWGYETRDEWTTWHGTEFVTRVSYTLGGVIWGGVIGTQADARNLCKRRGIKPEKITSTSYSCCIGFCEKDQKWYGWSHRAIFGFGIGHIVEKGSCCVTSGWTDEYLTTYPEEMRKCITVGFVAHTLDDCKKLAIAFADGVS